MKRPLLRIIYYLFYDLFFFSPFYFWAHVRARVFLQVFKHADSDGDGLINLAAFSGLLDDLELDLSDDDALARFREVDVDHSGELSLDEFERFFEALIAEWRATEDDPHAKIQAQYRPLLTLYEPDLGVFGNNADGKRKGFLLLMQRNGFVFWSDKDVAEVRVAGHWASRLGFDDAREAFELAAAYQTGGASHGQTNGGGGSSSVGSVGSVGARVSRLATLRFVRAMAPDGLPLSDGDFERLVWQPHVTGDGPPPGQGGNRNVAGDRDHLEMDLSAFRRFANDSALPRFFQQLLRAQREAKAAAAGGHQKKGPGAGGSSGGGGLFGAMGSLFGGGGGGGDGGDDGGGGQGGVGGEDNEDAWRSAFEAVDLDGSGDLDIEEVRGSASQRAAIRNIFFFRAHTTHPFPCP
jgi:hypothetical protein